MTMDSTSTKLRRRAEELIDKSSSQLSATPPTEIQSLLHELQIYQTELEIQNDELRSTQLELTASRDRLSDLYDFAPVGYVTVCSTGRILAANLTAAELLRVPRQTLVSSFFSQFVSERDSDKLFHHYKSVRSTDQFESCELQLAEDQNWAGRDIRVHSIRDRTSSDTIHVAITDITEAKAAEKQLATLKEKVRKADRLNDLGTIAGGVAHDFNNLLTPVMSYAFLSSRLAAADSPIQDYLKGIKTAAEEAAKICRSMLDYIGRGEVAKNASLDAVTLMDGLKPVLVPIVPANIQLDIDVENSLPAIRGDRTQIGRVVMNLVTNAVEAIDGQGQIHVSIRQTLLADDRIAQMALPGEIAAGRFVELRVTDTGSGMNKDTLNQIFDPFFTTKFSGRGLGMAAIVGIVGSHNAGVDIQSQPGDGSSIGVFFPVCDLLVENEIPAQIDDSLVMGAGTVLIVDDEDAVRNATGLVLQLAGYQIQQAASGAEAIEIFSQSNHGIDLVIMDLMMPEMDGVTALEKIRCLQADVKVVLTSGFTKAAAMERLRHDPVAGYLVKPSEIGVLTSEISRVMNDSQN